MSQARITGLPLLREALADEWSGEKLEARIRQMINDTIFGPQKPKRRKAKRAAKPKRRGIALGGFK